MIRLGTRKSLLALSQSSWIATELQKRNPGLSIELVKIETQGDRIQDVPLWKLEGKEFFAAELDQALMQADVDFTVHSLKDLSLDRPKEFIHFVPKREDARDVVIFSSQGIENLDRIRIGTSSPRRNELVGPFLKKALPCFHQDEKVELEFVQLRGNVNTRLKRIQMSKESDEALDGVVLAFAGLIRLWRSKPHEISSLLSGARWMVLPLLECPTTPGQGALAVECRRADDRMKRLLGEIHCPNSESLIQRERRILKEWGGGCHQKMGATAFEHEELGQLFSVRGVRPNGDKVHEFSWPESSLNIESVTKNSPNIWDGSRWRRKLEKELSIKEIGGSIAFQEAVFVAHSRAVRRLDEPYLKSKRVWTSGIESWFRLAERGLWVEGCAEGLGFDWIYPVLQEPVLKLPKFSEWDVMTHCDAESGWSEDGENSPRVLATYEIPLAEESFDTLQEELAQATLCYWSSGSQWDRFGKDSPKGALHFCGPGKTKKHLLRHGIQAIAVPSAEEWRKWLKKNFVGPKV